MKHGMVVALVSVLAVAFTAGFVATRHADSPAPHVATQAEVDAWTKAYCDAERRGLSLPSPSPIHMEGGFTLTSIDCVGA